MDDGLSVAELLQGHVTLDVECFDRLYLNAYVPTLQTPGGTVYFLTHHRGYPIPSPALFRPMGQAFRAAVEQFASDRAIPVLRFSGRERKLDVVRPYLDDASCPGVVAIGIAQEVQRVTIGADVKRGETGVPHYSFRRVDRRVTVFYFYIWDEDWGPCFIKICSYFPYPVKVWCNGHEWVKRQLDHQGIGYEALANGFRSTEDPAALRRLSARVSPRKVQDLFDRWMAVIPLPLEDADRAAGFDWELSMNQVEFSKTLVLDAPRRARVFFETVIAQNLGLGRPSEVELIFARRVQRNTPGRFSTRVVTDGVDPRISIHYQHSRIKQYLKEGRAVRIETVINNPTDIGVKRRIRHLGEIAATCRKVNRRILDVQRVACAPDLSTSLFEKVALPDERAGQRTVALRYGDDRVMALMSALTLCLHQVAGLTNRSLRPLVATLLGRPYRSSQMTYDLRRLRAKGLIRRLKGTHTYVLTPDGIRVAAFYTKTYERILKPLLAIDAPDAPPRANPEIRAALRVIDRTIDRYVKDSGIAA